MAIFHAYTAKGEIMYWRCFVGVLTREMLKFWQQRTRLLSALVRPLLWLFVFALMAPLGNIVGNLFQEYFTTLLPIFDYVLAVVLGMFLHISTTILFESDESHKFNLKKLIVIIVGGTAAYMVV